MKLPKSVPDRGPLLPLGILSPSSLHFVESDMMSTFVRRRKSMGVPRAGLEVSHIPHLYFSAPHPRRPLGAQEGDERVGSAVSISPFISSVSAPQGVPSGIKRLIDWLGDYGVWR